MKKTMQYVFLSLFIFVFAQIYEYFSHGVYSNYMLYAFLIPFLGLALPSFLLHSLKKSLPANSCFLWKCGIATFTVGSIHEGVITEIIDNKGAVVALPYGIEGFATQKHLVKEDGSKAQVDEKLPFKVLEFNKEKHRIIVSHSRTFEDKQRSERASEGAERKPARRAEETAAQAPVEKATLGDLGALAALRDQLDENN